MAQKKSENQKPSLGLTDLLGALRQEIEAAQTRFSSAVTPMFTLKAVEAELNFVVDRTTSAGGGFNIHLFAVDAKHSYRSENVQKLKVILEPCSSGIGVADGEDRSKDTTGGGKQP